MLDTHNTIAASKAKDIRGGSISRRGAGSERLSPAVCPHVPRPDSSHQTIHLDSVHILGSHVKVLHLSHDRVRVLSRGV
jgi:hypothetical protein